MFVVYDELNATYKFSVIFHLKTYKYFKGLKMTEILYVPILQTKRGEYTSLVELEDTIKHHIKPVFTLTQQECEARAMGLAKSLDDKWKGLPCYIDLTTVHPFQINNIDYVDYIVAGLLNNTNAFNLIINAHQPYQKILDNIIQYNLPACIKVDISKYDTNTVFHVQQLLNQLAVTNNDIDLIISFATDIKPSRTAHAHYISHYYNDLKNNLINRFGKIIISGSSIPKGLERSDYNPYGLEPRTEWLGFDDFLLTLPQSTFDDKPIFSDFSITYAHESEPLTYVNPNAKVRYTISDNYLFAVGYQVHTHTDGFGQYYDISALIVNSPYFMGGLYSWGDKYLEDCALRTTGPGNMETWIKVGHNHHITFVTRDIASRYGISL